MELSNINEINRSSSNTTEKLGVDLKSEIYTRQSQKGMKKETEVKSMDDYYSSE